MSRDVLRPLIYGLLALCGLIGIATLVWGAIPSGAPVVYTGTDLVTMPAGTTFTAQTLNSVGALTASGSLTASALLAWNGVISPPQLTADQNDYNPTGLSTANTVRFSTDASRTLTGLVGGSPGRVLLVHNVGTQPLLFTGESVSSAAVNRFAFTATLLPSAFALLQYDGVSTRWRMTSGEATSWYTPPLQTIATSGSVNCNAPAGNFIGTIAPTVSAGGLVSLGAPQILAGTRPNQYCLIMGTHDVDAILLGDGSGVQLVQSDAPVTFTSRVTMILLWTGTIWRQVDQAGAPGSGGTTISGLQNVCNIDCRMQNLTSTHPFEIAPDGPTGPKERKYGSGGSFITERLNGDNTPAAHEVIRIHSSDEFVIQAQLGSPPSWQDVGRITNVGGVSLDYAGIFAAPTADQTSVDPVNFLTAGNVQQAIAELALRSEVWHLPWSASGAIVDGTNCVLQSKALLNSGPSVVAVICADAAGTIEFNFDTPARYNGLAMNICFEVNDTTSSSMIWAAFVSAQFRASGQMVNNTFSTGVLASATMQTGQASYFACATVSPNGAAPGVGRVYVKATIDNAGIHNDNTARLLGGYVTGH